MPNRDKIPDAVVRRLPGYYRYLQQMERQGVLRMSSQEMGRRMGLTASQIRQDINTFGGFGQQGYGYHVPGLKQRIGEILGLDQTYRMIVLGAGNIGRAVAHDASFRGEGFLIDALFDIDVSLIGRRIEGAPILPMNALAAYLQSHPVDIAVIATPADQAQSVLLQVIAEGVRAIWNFAPVELAAPKDVLIHHVHLSDSLMTLAFRIHAQTAHESTSESEED